MFPAKSQALNSAPQPLFDQNALIDHLVFANSNGKSEGLQAKDLNIPTKFMDYFQQISVHPETCQKVKDHFTQAPILQELRDAFKKEHAWLGLLCETCSMGIFNKVPKISDIALKNAIASWVCCALKNLNAHGQKCFEVIDQNTSGDLLKADNPHQFHHPRVDIESILFDFLIKDPQWRKDSQTSLSYNLLAQKAINLLNFQENR